MNWDQTHVERASHEGWRLTTVIDNGTVHPYFMVTRISGSSHSSDEAAGKYVISMARNGSALHRHALHTIMQSRIKPTKKGTRK